MIEDHIRVEYLNSENIHALLYVLENNNDLDYLSIEKMDVMSTGKKLANALKTNSTGTLRYLSVVDTDGYLLNKTNKKSADVFTKELANALKTNNTLYKLHLDGNNISNYGMTHLGDALTFNKTLKRLDLSRNKIGDAGAQALAIALKSNKTLDTIDLSFNEIGDDGANALVKALKTNKTVKKLYLHGNNAEAWKNQKKKWTSYSNKSNQTLLNLVAT